MNKYKNFKDDALRSDWCREVGLDFNRFRRTKISILRARIMAHTLLTQHKKLLTNKQLETLVEFQKAANNIHKYNDISDAFCQCVMNIHTKINRKLFKEFRALNKVAMNTSKS